jgi:hypothetical protein
MKFRLLIFLTVISILANIFGSTLNSYATSLPGGASYNKGYLFGRTISSSTGIDQLLNNCNGSPFNSTMTNKTTLINRVVSYYTGACNGGRNDIGARFIMLSMLNRSAGASRSSGANLVTDWTNYVNNSNIGIMWVTSFTFDFNSGCYSNSGCDNGGEDAYYKNERRFGDAIVLYKKNNSEPVYALKYDCGNPVGHDDIEIQPEWDITPTATVSPSSVLPGATITWTHKVINNGPNATDTVVNYNFKNNSGFPNNSTGGSGTLPSGSASGASRTFTSTFVPGFGDIGKTFCRVTEAKPRARSNNGLIASVPPACATVTAPVNICRPILISIPNATTYPAQSHTAPNGTRYSAAAKTVSYTVSTSVQSWGPYTTAQNIDATLNHTTGDVYTVTFRETSNHVTGYTDNYVPVYNYVTTTSGTPPVTTRTRVAPFTRYSSTTTNYGGPATWTSSFGPCYDYMLTTNLNNFASKLEPDSVINISPTVNSSSWTQSNYRSFWNSYGTHSKSKPSKWQITKMVIAPNAALPAAVATRNSTATPCNNFDPTGITTCTAQATGASTVFSSNGVPSPSTNLNFSIPDSPAGTKLCFAFSLYPTQSDPSNTTSSWGAGDLWSHAAFNPASNCIIIVKKPKTQIWGGDLWVGKLAGINSKVSSSTSVKNIGGNHTFGSWVEYGIFSPDTISGTASGAAFAGSAGLAGSNQVCSYSTLTFTSAGSSICTPGTQKGIYSSSRIIPNVEANFPGIGTAITTNTVVVNNLHN